MSKAITAKRLAEALKKDRAFGEETMHHLRSRLQNGDLDTVLDCLNRDLNDLATDAKVGLIKGREDTYLRMTNSDGKVVFSEKNSCYWEFYKYNPPQ